MLITCLALALAPSGTTHFVDFNGPNGFPSIQAGVDAAASGDTIVIMEPEDYLGYAHPGFVIDGKALTIVIVEPAVNDEYIDVGRSTIRNIPLGETVSVSGLRFQYELNGDTKGGFEVVQCLGAVRFDSCDFQAGTGVNQDACVELKSALDVSLVDCTVSGNEVAGIRASQSRFTMYRCDVRGGWGATGHSYMHSIGGDGSDAIQLVNRSFAWMGESTVRGGTGGDAECTHFSSCLANAGDGGDGLIIESGSYGALLDTEVLPGERGTAFVGGAPGSTDGLPGVDIVGTPVYVPGAQRILDASSHVDSGQEVELAVHGLPGERALLLVGTQGGLRYLGPLHGPLQLNGGLLGPAIDLGVIPAGGVLETSVGLPVQATEEATTYALQAYCQASPTQFRLTHTRQVTVLGENTPLFEAPGVLYVRADAPSGGRGRSWQHPVRNLHDALVSLPVRGAAATEIWLARGSYTPASASDPTSRVALHLRPGMSLLGGFVGNEASPSERPLLSQSTITGDLLGDDRLPNGSRADNSRGLAGFPPTTFQAITRVSGIHFAGSEGTAVGVSARNTRFDRCTFTSNQGTIAAGAVDFYLSGQEEHLATFTSCRFTGNRGSYGGAVSSRAAEHNQTGGRVAFHNCEFIGNTTSEWSFISPNLRVWGSGVLYNTSPTTTAEITNCTFLDNETVPENPGEFVAFCGILSKGGPLLFRNNACMNAVSESGAYPVYGSFESALGHVAEHNASAWSWPGWNSSNVAAPPGFIDVLGPDGVRATGDEDLRLQLGSPCVDAGNSTVLPATIRYDIRGAARYADDPTAANTGIGSFRIIDMGAHERL